jgi:hypothetical protein
MHYSHYNPSKNKSKRDLVAWVHMEWEIQAAPCLMTLGPPHSLTCNGQSNKSEVLYILPNFELKLFYCFYGGAIATLRNT